MSAPVPSLSLSGCYIASKAAETLVDMALHRGLKEEYDEAFLAWVGWTLRTELARKRQEALETA